MAKKIIQPQGTLSQTTLVSNIDTVNKYNIAITDSESNKVLALIPGVNVSKELVTNENNYTNITNTVLGDISASHSREFNTVITNGTVKEIIDYNGMQPMSMILSSPVINAGSPDNPNYIDTGYLNLLFSDVKGNVSPLLPFNSYDPNYFNINSHNNNDGCSYLSLEPFDKFVLSNYVVKSKKYENFIDIVYPTLQFSSTSETNRSAFIVSTYFKDNMINNLYAEKSLNSTYSTYNSYSNYISNFDNINISSYDVYYHSGVQQVELTDVKSIGRFTDIVLNRVFGLPGINKDNFALQYKTGFPELKTTHLKVIDTFVDGNKKRISGDIYFTVEPTLNSDSNIDVYLKCLYVGTDDFASTKNNDISKFIQDNDSRNIYNLFTTLYIDENTGDFNFNEWNYYEPSVLKYYVNKLTNLNNLTYSYINTVNNNLNIRIDGLSKNLNDISTSTSYSITNLNNRINNLNIPGEVDLSGLNNAISMANEASKSASSAAELAKSFSARLEALEKFFIQSINTDDVNVFIEDPRISDVNGAYTDNTIVSDKEIQYIGTVPKVRFITQTNSELGKVSAAGNMYIRIKWPLANKIKYHVTNAKVSDVLSEQNTNNCKIRLFIQRDGYYGIFSIDGGDASKNPGTSKYVYIDNHTAIASIHIHLLTLSNLLKSYNTNSLTNEIKNNISSNKVGYVKLGDFADTLYLRNDFFIDKENKVGDRFFIDTTGYYTAWVEIRPSDSNSNEAFTSDKVTFIIANEKDDYEGMVVQPTEAPKQT